MHKNNLGTSPLTPNLDPMGLYSSKCGLYDSVIGVVLLEMHDLKPHSWRHQDLRWFLCILKLRNVALRTECLNSKETSKVILVKGINGKVRLYKTLPQDMIPKNTIAASNLRSQGVTESRHRRCIRTTVAVLRLWLDPGIKPRLLAALHPVSHPRRRRRGYPLQEGE